MLEKLLRVASAACLTACLAAGLAFASDGDAPARDARNVTIGENDRPPITLDVTLDTADDGRISLQKLLRERVARALAAITRRDGNFRPDATRGAKPRGTGRRVYGLSDGPDPIDGSDDDNDDDGGDSDQEAANDNDTTVGFHPG